MVIALVCTLCHRHHYLNSAKLNCEIELIQLAPQEHSLVLHIKTQLAFEVLISTPYTRACSCLSSASVSLLISTASFTLERVEEKEVAVAKQAEVAKVGFWYPEVQVVAHQIWQRGSSGSGTTKSVPLSGKVPAGKNTATAYGSGGGKVITIPSGSLFSGRTAGGGSRSQVFGSR